MTRSISTKLTGSWKAALWAERIRQDALSDLSSCIRSYRESLANPGPYDDAVSVRAMLDYCVSVRDWLVAQTDAAPILDNRETLQNLWRGSNAESEYLSEVRV